MEKSSETRLANRNYKDTIFRMLFENKENLLSLYNAIGGTSYDNSEELTVVTLENAVYMNMKNDLAFILGMQLNLYEHQSTLNPNLPLRFLFYVSAEYQSLTRNKTLYSDTLIRLPAPKFFVFYNGEKPADEQRILNLSDAFQCPADTPDLELRVTQLNINTGFNEAIKDTCQTLKEYMQYTDCVRKYAKNMPLNEAVETAIEFCITNGILADFLRKNRSEAYAVSIFEYDAERVRQILDEEKLAEGKSQYRQLILAMQQDGREHEVVRLATDPLFENEMMTYYKII